MDKKKSMMLLFLLTATAMGAYAQGNGMAGINEATKMVTSYFDPGTKLIYAVGAVVGLIGGIKVYNKFSSGDPRYEQDRSLLVRCVYLLDCGCHYPEKFLPVRRWLHLKSTRV